MIELTVHLYTAAASGLFVNSDNLRPAESDADSYLLVGLGADAGAAELAAEDRAAA